MDIAKGKYWDVAWNPIVGCLPVSAGCDNCWAARMARRFRDTDKYRGLVNKYGNWNGLSRWVGDVMKPRNWKKPRVIAVCWMGDMFNGTVLDKWIREVFLIMAEDDRHTYLVLTKRAGRMAEFVNDFASKMGVLDNVWLGVTVENQAAADERVPDLLRCDGWHKWVSVEPMLGPIDFTWVGVGNEKLDAIGIEDIGPRIEQVVCGGESGPGVRPIDPCWVHRMQIDCLFENVPFFFKQWGKIKVGRQLHGVKCDELAWVGK